MVASSPGFQVVPEFDASLTVLVAGESHDALVERIEVLLAHGIDVEVMRARPQKLAESLRAGEERVYVLADPGHVDATGELFATYEANATPGSRWLETDFAQTEPLELLAMIRRHLDPPERSAPQAPESSTSGPKLSLVPPPRPRLEGTPQTIADEPDSSDIGQTAIDFSGDPSGSVIGGRGRTAKWILPLLGLGMIGAAAAVFLQGGAFGARTGSEPALEVGGSDTPAEPTPAADTPSRGGLPPALAEDLVAQGGTGELVEDVDIEFDAAEEAEAEAAAEIEDVDGVEAEGDDASEDADAFEEAGQAAAAEAPVKKRRRARRRRRRAPDLSALPTLAPASSAEGTSNAPSTVAADPDPDPDPVESEPPPPPPPSPEPEVVAPPKPSPAPATPSPVAPASAEAPAAEETTP